MKIKVNGKDKTDKIGEVQLSTSDEANGEELSFTSLERMKNGDIVTVWADKVKQFEGQIVSWTDAVKPPYTYKCLDYTRNLQCDTVIQFKKVRADEAIKKLLKKYGVKCNVCNMPTKITKIYNCTILEAIKDIMKHTKHDQGKSYYLEVRGSTVYVEEKKSKKIKTTFIIQDDASIERSIEERRNKIVATKGSESVKILAEAENKTSEKKFGVLQHNLDVDEKTTKIKAKSKAENALKELDVQKNSTQLNLLVTKGAWNIRRNRLMYIDEARLKGWYRVREATHTITDGTHYVNVTLEWSTK